MGSRRRARELALQLLYQYELTHGELEQMQADFDEWRGATDAVREFADALLRGTLEHLAEIDGELEQQTAHWRLDRLAAVDRNIIRLAMYELLFQSATPHAVVIDEAIEIAKKYGAEESPRFVNGVLDGFLKRKVGTG
ncbi:MAG TPA: transcription antitermination factor NusB [Thermoanaerobaculales bacterium]|nr:transcription antitermination factor NusB [Thermoanaerobaculales bacterium]HQL29792.1 transcription antitermination factor NusB [Thermoanaerobaculales bacterium]HQN97112.1 transcription antitermination factor NusB [Thermoanaerobaculales bacterium]HQP43367.1 transcription antitermination factor NusB [Thermoanaerobaculales bacterium]